MKNTAAVLILLLVFLRSEAQISGWGCTDAAALNYSSSALYNDGSCVYSNAQITPDTSIVLNDTLDETSGLIMWNGMLWTHVDDTDTRLYGLDSSDGNITVRDSMLNVTNIDMEDIAQDSQYIYVGDFGNNANGNRTNLCIYRFRKDSLLTGKAKADTIAFAYADQTDFTPQGAYNTDFDCEAFIVTNDSIFLFTKQWVSFGTTIYSLPKDTGFHLAQPQSHYNIQGLVTGATYLPDQHLIALVGYSPLIQPWMMLLYDYSGTFFFTGNKRKFNLAIGTSQTEAIASGDGGFFYITNERRTISSVTLPQQLHIFDMRVFTDPFIHTDVAIVAEPDSVTSIFPVPAETDITICTKQSQEFTICNATGATMKSFSTEAGSTTISVADLTPGLYFIVCTDKKIQPIRFVKL
ncbi:MAG: hypothetical protein RL007_1338 [Bacteroidota bacterium]|jgi:hypothetical protein